MARSSRFTPVAIVVLALGCAALATTALQTQTPGRNGGSTARMSAATAGDTQPPVAKDSARFAVIGDTGTGDRAQYDVGAMLARSRQVFPFEFVIMMGDNLYGSERPQDYVRKFEMPYKTIIDAKIPFYATLGNHDDPNQRFYKFFNMDGKRYYTFRPKPDVRFFVLDSNYMDREQLAWLEKELAASDSKWKIAYFHHPIYSSGGRHGSEIDLRTQVEPLFLKHNVSVVFAGHEHFYERLNPQKGIHYFTCGGAAKLRKGDILKTGMTAVGFDTDYSYMLAEIAGDTMYFQALTRGGKKVDSGSITRSTRTTNQEP